MDHRSSVTLSHPAQTPTVQLHALGVTASPKARKAWASKIGESMLMLQDFKPVGHPPR
jgi:hypothetical protein